LTAEKGEFLSWSR